LSGFRQGKDAGAAQLGKAICFGNAPPEWHGYVAMNVPDFLNTALCGKAVFFAGQSVKPAPQMSRRR
jgi:hypothetical protein